MAGPALPGEDRRFTCYPPSTRGRGLSAEHPDLSPERRLEDITAFVDCIGDPVALAGTPAGAVLAMDATARTSAVAAAMAFEPPAPEALSEDEAHQLDIIAKRD